MISNEDDNKDFSSVLNLCKLDSRSEGWGKAKGKLISFVGESFTMWLGAQGCKEDILLRDLDVP